MRVLIHDFGGYAFPMQLSEQLAADCYEVVHAWCASTATTPKGDFSSQSGGPARVEQMPLSLGEPIAKQGLLKRRNQEARYGQMLARAAASVRPDVVVSANAPLDAQLRLQAACGELEIPFVFWLQDVIGAATGSILRRRLGVLGAVVGRHYASVEARLLRASDAVVTITDDFRPLLAHCGVSDERISTIENWAPVERLPLRPKDNPWSTAQGLGDTFNLVYTGTLALKHDASLLVELADRFADRPTVRVVVVSEGSGADSLRRLRDERQLGNLILLPYQPFEQLPDVMGTADVLVALLERDAGMYSVPSKVTAYLCAGRPLLLSVPAENLAARIVRNAGAGIVSEPGDRASFVEAAETLLADNELRVAMGASGRRYAEQRFSIVEIATRFEEVIEAAVRSHAACRAVATP